MTKDDILNMSAGREMDALVAEFIMGEKKPIYSHNHPVVTQTKWSTTMSWYCSPQYENGDVCEWLPKPYSTDISAAWEVVEKVNGIIEELGVNYNYLTLESLDSKNYAASFDSIIDDPEWYEDVTNYRYAARAETASLAICRAALLAIMDNKDV